MDKAWHTCAWRECDNKFQKRTWNQAYCARECTMKATNEEMMVKYYKNKERMLQTRICTHDGCGTVLSIYNPQDVCSVHEREVISERIHACGGDCIRQNRSCLKA